MSPRRRDVRGEGGSAAVEFVLVGAMLTVLTVSVIQLGLVLLIRNTVLDAAAEGARYAALADNSLSDGLARTRELIGAALGPGYARGVSASYGTFLGYPSTVITVRTPLPMIGLIGIDGGLEVTGHAAVETLD